MTGREEWRKIILSINDNTFFDLMRNYLGKIESPFNKQDLVDRLINFLSRDDISETVLSLIDEDDTRLLTALSLSGGLTENQLRGFFNQWSYLELLNRLRNLEERFLIYRRKGFCCLSPLFEEGLNEKIVSPTHLIRTTPAEPAFDPVLWLNDPLMLALYPLLSREGNLIKNDGSLNKRGLGKLEQIFQPLFTGPEGLERFDLCLKVLENLELVENTGTALQPVRNRWKQLATLSTGERYCLYYGAALADSAMKTGQAAEFFARFYNRFPSGKILHKESLRPFLTLYCGAVSVPAIEKYVEVLKELQILMPSEEGFRLNGMLNLDSTDVNHEGAALILQPNFEVTVKPHVSFSRAMEIIDAFDIDRYDLFSRYILSKNSFLGAFNRGLKPERFFTVIEEMCGREIPQNIAVSLHDWAEEYRKATIYRGTVLKVAEDKALLISKTGYLDPYILEELAEGVYLLDSEKERLWSEALEKLSITPGEGISIMEKVTHSLPSLPVLHRKKVIAWEERERENVDKSDELEARLLKALEKKGIKGDEKEELEARIRRKLIIDESQLNRGIVRPEITEARGMNFHGKVRLIEAALQNPSDRLELSYFSHGETITVFLKPVEMNKKEHERILIGKILPDEEPFSIRVGKISRIRKIHSSLF